MERVLLPLPLLSSCVGRLVVGGDLALDLVAIFGAVANRRSDLLGHETQVGRCLVHVPVRRPNGLHHLPDVEPPALDAGLAPGGGGAEDDPLVPLAPESLIE